MIVVAMIIDGMIVKRIRSMGIASTHLAVMLDGIAARIARMRAENRDQPGDYSADQWQKHDCLIIDAPPCALSPDKRNRLSRENRNQPTGPPKAFRSRSIGK